MVLIKWSAIISDMRGKLNGTVFSRNRGGFYARNKVTPYNPSTFAQYNIRKQMALLSATWRTLTPEQITAWNMAVDDFLHTNIFGDRVKPSGFNLFIRLNMNLYDIGQPTILFPPVPAPVDVIQIKSVLVNPYINIIMVDIKCPPPIKHIPVLFATRPVSNGISNADSRCSILNWTMTSTIDPDVYRLVIGNYYKAKYGNLKNHFEQHFFLKVIPIDPLTGLNGIQCSRFVSINR